MTITRLYTGSDGLSHFERKEVEFSPVAGEPGKITQAEPASPKKSYLVRCAPGFFSDWHNADVRRYIVPIRGQAEIVVTNGEKLVVQPGYVFLAEDLTGKGHTFRVIGDSDWVAMFVDLNR